MNYIFKPSLKEIALVNISTILWNQPYIREIITGIIKSDLFLYTDEYYSYNFKLEVKWKTIEHTVRGTVSQLSIPESLKERISDYYIEPIGVQILKWLEYHCRNYSFDLDIPNVFCWTPQGLIDNKRTAEFLIKDESIHLILRYKLALIYCLENDIPKLWNKLPERVKRIFHNKEYPNKLLQPELMFLWAFCSKENFESLCMIRERSNLECSYQDALQCAAKCGNKAATRYFLEKVTSKEEPLLKAAMYITKNLPRCWNIKFPPREYYIDVLCFLLSQMNHTQQLKVFETEPCYILLNLLDCWPWQMFFVETASRMWKFLDPFKYQMLVDILVQAKLKSKDYNYRKMFGEFWKITPNDFQRELMSGIHVSNLISTFLIHKDKENIELIFATSVDKKQFIFSDNGKFVCKKLIKKNNYKSLKYFVQVFISSEDEILALKHQWYWKLNSFLRKKDRLRVFLENFDAILRAYKKRPNTNEDYDSPAKRRCI